MAVSIGDDFSREVTSRDDVDHPHRRPLIERWLTRIDNSSALSLRWEQRSTRSSALPCEQRERHEFPHHVDDPVAIRRGLHPVVVVEFGEGLGDRAR